MKLKKGKKSRKMQGSRYHGFAAKKHKGSGNRGGKGMAGTGKRAGQKLTFIHRYLMPYFGKQGFTSKSTKRKKTNQINVGDIQKKYKPGEVSLENYKILGKGEIKDKFTIKAKSFSKSAKEKIEKAGGKIIPSKTLFLSAIRNQKISEVLGKEEKPEEHKKSKVNNIVVE